MRYLYKCNNKECVNFDKEVTINKPMSESSRKEICKKCNSLLYRVYGIGGIKTGDGMK